MKGQSSATATANTLAEKTAATGRSINNSRVKTFNQNKA